MIPPHYSFTFTVRYTPTRFTRPVVPILSGVPNFRLNVWSAWRHYRLQKIRELPMQPIPAKRIHHVRLRLASCTLFLLPVMVFVFAVPGNSQQTEPQTPPSTNMGVSTGAARPAVKDSKSRPITAGGFVDGAPVVFTDVTKQAGLDKFHHRSGTREKTSIIETPGSGVALLDYDNDGWLDIYLLNGSTHRGIQRQRAAASRHALSQQPRRHIYRRHRQSGRRQRALGIRRGRRRLRQRRLARHLRRQYRQEPSLSQQPRRHIYRRGREGRRDSRRLVHGPDLGRLRPRRPARSVCSRLREVRRRPSADRRTRQHSRPISASFAASM